MRTPIRQPVGYDSTEQNADLARSTSRMGGSGGAIAAIVSAIALLFSGFSLYESTLKQAELVIYVSPVMEYADPDKGPFEVFQVPITIANRGARPATVLSIDVIVNNVATGEVKRFYAANLGRWREAYNGGAPLFAPIAVAGSAAFSGEVLFYTRRGEELNRVTSQEAGTYRMTIDAATTASTPFAIFGQADDLARIRATVNVEMDDLDYRAFSNGGTLAMYNVSFKETAGQTSDPAPAPEPTPEPDAGSGTDKPAE